MQTNLKQMLAMPKHNTLDMNGQNMAIQHLRSQVRRFSYSLLILYLMN